MPHEPQTRKLNAAPAKGGLYAATVSSETPYERYFGPEVLDHSPGAVDLSRADSGSLPLLLNHDRDQIIGRAENVRIEGRRLKADLRFFDTERGREAQTMVDGGHRELSLAYEVKDMVEEVVDGHSVFRVKRWMPYEISVVAIPADATVGIGRSHTTPTLKGKKTMQQDNTHYGDGARATSPALPADAELKRRDTIDSLAASYRQYVTEDDRQKAIREGWSAERFQERIMDKMSTRATDIRGPVLDLTPRDVQRYSFGRALVAAVTGDWQDAGYERECSIAVAKRVGSPATGFYVPHDVFRRDFNVGTSTEAGNLVATDMRGDLYVDALRANMVLGQLGVRILPGLSSNIDIPRKATPSTLAMVTEIGSASETNPLTAKLTMTPKRVSAYVEVSKQALIQSALSLEGMIRDDLVTGAAVLLENQAFNGAGTGANLLGIRNTSGIGTSTAGANGATVAWQNVVDLESACANVNANPGALAGYAFNTKTRAKMKTVQRGTNLDFIIPGDAPLNVNGLSVVNGYRAGFTNNLPSNLTKGTSTTVCSGAIFSSDWSMAVLAFFGGADVTVDPYTLAATGQVRITLSQFADFGIRQPAAFAKIEDLLTA
jgi:HK97 family phage major capsid protein/HK97 family phage prohead protease